MSRSQNTWLVVASAVCGMLVLGWAGVLLMRLGLTYPCPFKFLFGLPCPTCGTTRSLAALAAFDVIESLRFNPLVLLGSLAALTAYGLRDRFSALRQLGLPLFVGALLLNWLYLLLFLPR
jgi:hypothetical protein